LEIRTGTRCNPKNYTVGRSDAVRYLVIHYTGNDGDTAENNVRYFANNSVGASAHFFVDANEVVTSVPESDTAWHCGAKTYQHPQCRNSNSIGIELCSYRENGVYNFLEGTLNNAAELTAFLSKKYEIPVNRILRHYDVTGKQCPEPMLRDAELWQKFLKEVELRMEVTDLEKRITALESANVYQRMEEIPQWARPTVEKFVQKGILQGDGTGALGLTNEMLRVFVIHDRLGLYN